MILLTTATNQVIKLLAEDHVSGVYSLLIHDESTRSESAATINSVTQTGSFLTVDFDFASFVEDREYVIKLKNDGEVISYSMGFVSTQDSQTYSIYDGEVTQPPNPDNSVVVYEG